MKTLSMMLPRTCKGRPRLSSGGPLFWRHWRCVELTALLIVLLAVGCKKQQAVESPASTSTEQLSSAPVSKGAPDSNAAATVVIPNSGDINTILHELSLELRRYVVRTHSVPKNFEEFAAKSQAQIPAPPAGKKYAIQGQVVVLVKR